ncbi:hypothetical protein [Chamaesiphon minutus]|uniref:Lipoprotein n=1 Tax=Chamaesiphon minutus (strain ATCC 27169 / PCC 6605) TaxID=1173020 RepID=K9UDX5_CHAP6|nr:hypothetical protein [Chamaesiphon minutus]AFY93040.1 hypothetical protein Cha6605_1933 [Chamaesiphon minutus PCC 6605]
MKLVTSAIIGLASTGLLLLGACSKEAKTSDSASPDAATPTTETATPAATTSPAMTTAKAEKSEGGKSKGGQVVESGKYHFEFVPEKGSKETHLDLYLQKGDTHEAITNAKVTADVQSPDGKLKTIPLSYDASGKHYAGVVSDKTAGQYQVKVTATIGSEQADGRFNFDR